MKLLRLVVSGLAVLALSGFWLVPDTAYALSKPSAKKASVSMVAAEGGSRLTITGKNLKKVSAVYFGSTKTTKITHLSSTTLSVTAPKHTPAAVKLRLRVGKKTYSTSVKVTYVITRTQPSATEAEVLQLVNAARASGYTCTDAKTATDMPAVPALTWDARLGYAARTHSADMAARNYFAHTSRDATAFSTRITRAGYVWSTVGENIAAGQPTPAEVVSAWLASSGHCKILMSAGFTNLGVGVATGGSHRIYWTQDFGRPRG